MAASTTTIETIRDTLETKIEAVTPDAVSTIPFRVSRGDEDDFRGWAVANKQSSLRRYTIEQSGETDEGFIRNSSEEEYFITMEVTVAYPHLYGLYESAGLENRQDLLDMIEEDAEAIQNVAGMAGNANYPAGSHPLSDDYGIEQGEGVTFLVMPIAIRYYRSTAT